MAKLADLLGNANKMDLYRVAKNEEVPKRGRKKHYTQMSKKETDYLFSKLRGVKRWGLSYHALDRIEEKGIEVTYEDIVSTIYNSNIIEYHVTKYKGENDSRVLLRSKSLVNGENNLHVVYSISRKKIISSWLNHKNDKHKTIDMRDYSGNVKII
jgi:hypothetical protein